MKNGGVQGTSSYRLLLRPLNNDNVTAIDMSSLYDAINGGGWYSGWVPGRRQNEQYNVPISQISEVLLVNELVPNRLEKDTKREIHDNIDVPFITSRSIILACIPG